MLKELGKGDRQINVSEHRVSQVLREGSGQGTTKQK